MIQINHQPDATIFQFTILTLIYSLTFFGRFPAHHQELDDCSGSLWFYFRIVVTVVLFSWSGRPPGVLHLIQINHQTDATIFQFIILKSVYSSTCFGRFPAHHQELNDCSGSLWQPLGRPARPRTQHDCHDDTKVTPEATTPVIGLLMMGGKTPETC